MGTALVTGVTGQLGYYVAQLLAKRGDKVYGLVRQSTLGGRTPTDPVLPYTPLTGDLLDEYSLLSMLEQIAPDRIFNFGAQSFIPSSWTQPMLTAQYTGLGVVRLLEAARRAVPKCRVLQAGSSELFAGAEKSPQNEQTPICPLNPYGIAKAFAYHTVRAYRDRYGQFATNAIFFTNESPRRSPEFMFRKATRGVAEIMAGGAKKLSVGNLNTIRDWGYAPEYASLSIALLDLEAADDFVIATGEGRSIHDLISRAFQLVGRDWEPHVQIDQTLVRSSEKVPMVGDTSKLRQALGRSPKVKFEVLLRSLLAYDLERVGVQPPFEVPRVDAGEL